MTQTIEPETSASPMRLRDLRDHRTGLPPVILLGGEFNALSVARSLSRLGVAVYALNDPDAYVRFSRHCRWIPLDARASGEGDEEAWARYLLGRESDHLRGALLWTCSDAGIQVLSRYREELSARFLLDAADPPAQLCMLDKLATYRAASAAGVATPRFWVADSRADVEELRNVLVFPLIVKPRLSHVFQERFGRKHMTVENFDELLDVFGTTSESGIDLMLVEWIPGPDDRLCSYYTYIDDTGEHLFHFTKRVLRRYPFGMGGATYHVTDWSPDLVAPARALFQQVGLRGLANVEFKRDERDGEPKLIECNARFTASTGLVAASGYDLAAFVYNRLVGRPQPPLEGYTRGLRLWDPLRDLRSYRELRARGEITFRGWLASVLHPQTFPVFRWTDPLPALARAARPLLRWWARRGRGGSSEDPANAEVEVGEAPRCQTS